MKLTVLVFMAGAYTIAAWLAFAMRRELWRQDQRELYAAIDELLAKFQRKNLKWGGPPPFYHGVMSAELIGKVESALKKARGEE